MKSTFSLRKVILLCALFLFFIKSFSQVGVGTVTPRGALDISSSTQGMIPPQVALTNISLQAPVINPQGGVIPNGTMVWNTNTTGAIPNNVSPGLYYWLTNRWISVAGSPGGLDWSIIGNGGIDGGDTGITGVPATAGTHFVGTYDITNFDIRTSGLHAARVSSLGEFFIGALETVLPGDLMNGVSEGNTVFPWAVNGYTDQNGGGVYGSVTAGSTNFAAVQGEYVGTGANGSGVRGINFDTATNGTAFFAPKTGVIGSLATDAHSNTSAFGVFGDTASNSGRTVGGILGVNFSNGMYAMLAYERSNGNNYAGLGSTNWGGGLGSKTTGNNSTNASIGFGFQGGFLGGHTQGNQYGFIAKGDLVGIYSDGSTITNKGFAVVNKDKNGNKKATYASTSTTVDVSTKGTGKLINGEAFISFEQNYSNLVSGDKPIIVTVSPMGESNGVYIAKVSKDGFTVKENNNGNSNVPFYWIAIGEKHDAHELIVPLDIIDERFEENLNSVLTIDENKETSKAMWWNGSKLEFGNVAPTNSNEGIKRKDNNTQRYDEKKRTPRKANLRESQLKTLKKKD